MVFSKQDSTQEVMEGDLSLTDLGLQSKLSRLE